MPSMFARLRGSKPSGDKQESTSTLSHSSHDAASRDAARGVTGDSPTEEKKPDQERKDLESGKPLGAGLGPVTSRVGDSGAKVDVVEAYQREGSIKYRTMSWKKCACILFGEYVCLAILSFPWAFNTLGMAGGILSTLGLGLIALYTSMTLWRYCMLHPHMLHIADFGYQLFGKHWLAYELTAAALILNNTFIQGLHTLTGSEILNVLSEHGTCTLVFSIIIMIVCFLLTLPRKMENVAMLSIVSALSMFIAILLVMIFTGVQGRNPVGMDAGPPTITAWAPEGTTFVDGFNAFLNIVFTWVGQICYPSFIAEMEKPEDFPKALYAVTIAEFTFFTLTGIVVYYFNGQYTETPAVANLKPVFKKISFAFVLPTTIIIGVIYAAVVVKYLFHRFTFGTKHYNNNTVKGWTIWTLCCAATWLFGWVIGQAVPFFGVLLSLISALFDGWFGFIFWAAAYRELHVGELWVGQNWKRKGETIFNIFLAICGVFTFAPGTYTSVEAIIQSYASGSIKRPFTCGDNSV